MENLSKSLATISLIGAVVCVAFVPFMEQGERTRAGWAFGTLFVIAVAVTAWVWRRRWPSE